MQSLSKNSVAERAILDEFKSQGMQSGDKLPLGSLAHDFGQNTSSQVLTSMLQKGWIIHDGLGVFELTVLGFSQL